MVLTRRRRPDVMGGRRVSIAEQRVVVQGVGERGLDVRVHAPLPPLRQRGPLQLRQVVQKFVPDCHANRVLYRELRQFLHRRRGGVTVSRRFCGSVTHILLGPFFMFASVTFPRFVAPFRRNVILSLGILLFPSLLGGGGRRCRRRLLVRDELVTVAFLGEWNPVMAVCRQVRRRWRRRRRVRAMALLLRNLAFGGFCSAIAVSGIHPSILHKSWCTSTKVLQGGKGKD